MESGATAGFGWVHAWGGWLGLGLSQRSGPGAGVLWLVLAVGGHVACLCVKGPQVLPQVLDDSTDKVTRELVDEKVRGR